MTCAVKLVNQSLAKFFLVPNGIPTGGICIDFLAQYQVICAVLLYLEKAFLPPVQSPYNHENKAKKQSNHFLDS